MTVASPQPLRVLIVDDDPEIGSLVQSYLTDHGICAEHVSDGNAMDVALARTPADLVILDIMMPGRDGLTICQSLRGKVPVILLTAMTDETDRVLGLELGADDYITKPFSPRELLARIRAVTRRQRSGSSDNAPTAVCFDGWRLDRSRRELRSPAGALVTLTGAEFDLLSLLVAEAGAVLDRDTLLERTRGRSAVPFDRAIDVLVSRLRAKLNNKQLIKTVRGGGYQFSAPVEPVARPGSAQ